MSFTDDLRTLVRARYPIVWVQTHEEERVLRYVLEVAAKPKGDDGKAEPKDVLLWSQSKGIESVALNGEREVKDGEAVDPIAALESISKAVTSEPGKGRIVVMRDVHRFFQESNPTYRFLRDVHNAFKESSTTVLVTSPLANLPVELEKDVVVLDLPLPTVEELRVRLMEILEGVEGKVSKPTNGAVERILKAGLGLSEDEFAGVVKESLIRSKKVDPRVILRQKEQIIRKSGVVELFSSVEGLESVGGLDLLREWVGQRALAFSDKASKFGLKSPKGLLLVGPPGTGKTLTAKATASHLGVPLLAVNAESIFGRYVGESEGNLRKVLNLAEAVAPSLLFIDEGEKLIAGSSASGSASDSGVSRRILGGLLKFMENHTSPVLVVMTVNDPLGLPPELMSRFAGATFFVDLPQAQERLDILAIHIKKVGREPKNFDLEGLVRATEGFSGREIEHGINEALFSAFSDGEGKVDLADTHLFSVYGQMTPLSKSRRDDVERMREWAGVNAPPASVNNRIGAKKVTVDL